MTHSDSWRLSIGAYAAGSLDAAERAELERHLVTCPGCRHELAELQGLPALLSRVPQPLLVSADPTVGTHGLQGDLAARAGRLVARRRLRHQIVGTVAAVVVVAAGAAIGVAIGGGRSQVQPSSPRTGSLVFYLRGVSSEAGRKGSTATATLQSRQWGTAVVVNISNLPPATSGFVAWITGDGSRHAIGTWGPTHNGRATVTMATDMKASAITNVTVATGSGTVLFESYGGRQPLS